MKVADGYSFARKVVNVLKDEGLAVADLLVPRECAVCGKTLQLYEKHLCIYCEADLPLTRLWERRINPMADKLNAKIQENITAHEENEVPVKYSYATALFIYHGENRYKRIPQRLKYLGDITEGKYYAEMLGRFMKNSELFQDIDMIIPVPLHWSRQFRRGYNQAEVLARELGRVLNAEVRTDILVRSRRTQTQTKLDVAAKSQNVGNAFSVRVNAIVTNKLRHVLIVDDVFTTGATMSACMDVLQKVCGPETRLSAATLGYVSNY